MKRTTAKIQISLNKEIVAKIKRNADAYGLTVSAYCGYILGSTIAASESVINAGMDTLNEQVKQVK